MKYPFFASFIVLCFVIMLRIHKTREAEEKNYKSFMEEEARANSTRRKSLDDLCYITIPFEKLPMDTLCDDPQVADYQNTLKSLSSEPIVNLTGFTNTELKLKYGAPNIDILMRYDEAYTILARTLSQWARYLFDHEYINDARVISEFAISTNTDVSSTYELLIQINTKEQCPEKIAELIPVAENLNSLMKKSILEKLNNALGDETE